MRSFLIWTTVCVSILGGIYIFGKAIFINSETVCAHLEGPSAVKGQKVMTYSYKYKGKLYKGGFGTSEGICMDMYCYDKKKCFYVEISVLFPSISRVRHQVKRDKK